MIIREDPMISNVQINRIVRALERLAEAMEARKNAEKEIAGEDIAEGNGDIVRRVES